MQETPQESPEKTGDVMQLLISTDTLAIPIENRDYKVLLPGKDSFMYIVEGAPKSVERVIDLCYTAREERRAVELVFENRRVPLVFR